MDAKVEPPLFSKLFQTHQEQDGEVGLRGSRAAGSSGGDPASRGMFFTGKLKASGLKCQNAVSEYRSFRVSLLLKVS